MNSVSFFVYGSMCDGMVHFSKIKDFILSSRPAETKGTAYRMKVGYPVVTRNGNDMIKGHLVELKASDLLVNLLDEFHGYDQQNSLKSLHIREQIQVICCDSSETATAWAYVFNPEKIPATATVIENGDWQKSLSEKPPMSSTLTEKQRAYVMKLGGSSGREIVPIDLPLYRELMGLELIVDKGRRLALSKLGQEVYRFLS